MNLNVLSAMTRAASGVEAEASSCATDPPAQGKYESSARSAMGPTAAIHGEATHSRHSPEAKSL